MQKILYLGYVWPEPDSSAAGGRTMEFLRLFLAQGWEIVFASAAALSSHRSPLTSLGIREREVAINCDSFDQFIGEFQPDMVVFDRFFTEEQFGWRVERHCPHALRMLDTCDLHSLREARHHLLKAQLKVEPDAGPVLADPARLYQAMVQSDVAHREIAAIYRCDLSLMISSFEVALLREQFGVPASLLHETHLMATPAQQSLPDFTDRAHFISIGNFRHAPNWDAVLWLKQRIWPKIRRQLPSAQLHIYGAYPPPKAMALHNAGEGFHMLGWAADAKQVIAQARVVLAPLRFGAGLKGKLADAMSCGTPSVSTSIGSEGMCGELDWGGMIANDAQSFADAAVELATDKEAWQQAQARGWHIQSRLFDRLEAQQALLNVLKQAKVQQEHNRCQNFTGAMLRHHLHKSTQYMSQWIALKNRDHS